MKIGLDLSVIQTPHRMRGIGATALNFINNMPETAKKEHTFVIYLYEKGMEEALSLLDLQGITYQTRILAESSPVQLRLPGKLRIINRVLRSTSRLRDNILGDKRIGDADDLDAYLQFDQMQPLPKLRRTTKTASILYDLIPYVMEADYLWTYRTARGHGERIRSAVARSLARRKYISQAQYTARNADLPIAISEYTKMDFVRFTHANPKKVQVVYLGVDSHKATEQHTPKLQYVQNSWGYFQRPIDMSAKPFLLFVGGADPRRKLIDLVAAYNHLKARGYDIRLVFAGDVMKGPDAIPVTETQKYLAQSSYIDDIVFLGYVTDEEREWLYGHAVAMVYPSVYEGFGLPVLEAMQHGTPVITYRNTSLAEIAGDAALYAHDVLSIVHAVTDLMSSPKLHTQLTERGKKQARLYSWEKTAENIISLLVS